jgi:TRAP-type C4-dicarboxylate transport system permease small subunit
LRKVVAYLDKVVQGLTSVATALAGTCIILTVLIVCYEILMRGFFNAPTEWSIEFSVYLVLVSGFLGLAAALADDKHIKVDLLTSLMPPKANKTLGVMVSLAGLIFSFVLLIEGWEMMASSYELGRTSTSTLRIPLYLPQAAVPLGALLLTLQFIRKIVKDLVELFTKDTSPTKARVEG